MKSYRVVGLLMPAVPVFVVLALAFGSPYPAGAESAQGTQQVNITLKEFTVSPANVTVPEGVPVSFTVMNAGTIEHNFKVEMPSQGIEQMLFETNLKPGESRTAEYTFSVAGDWEMYCPVDAHENMGMKGSIQVMSAGDVGMPSTGDSLLPGLWLAMLAGLVLVGWGLRARRRGRLEDM